MKAKIATAICYVVRAPHHLTCVLFGEDHHPAYVIGMGLLVIICGTGILSIECHGLARSLCETSGMFIHGVGSYPIIEHIKKVAAVPKQ